MRIQFNNIINNYERVPLKGSVLLHETVSEMKLRGIITELDK